MIKLVRGYVICMIYFVIPLTVVAQMIPYTMPQVTAMQQMQSWKIIACWVVGNQLYNGSWCFVMY